MHDAALVLVAPFPGLETSAGELWNWSLSMGMATGHMDLMDDTLLPILVIHSLPRPVAFICTQMHGNVHNLAA